MHTKWKPFLETFCLKNRTLQKSCAKKMWERDNVMLSLRALRIGKWLEAFSQFCSGTNSKKRPETLGSGGMLSCVHKPNKLIESELILKFR